MKFHTPQVTLLMDIKAQGSPREQAKRTYDVQGKRASELEKIFSIALAKIGIEYLFNWRVYSPFQLPGQENLIDFMLVNTMQPIETDGEIAHKGAEQRQSDKARDQMVDEILRPQGYMPIIRVPGTKVDTLEKALRWIRSNV